MNTVMHFINGRQVANSSSRTGNVFNPALGEVVRQVSLAETKDAKAAIQAASDAYPSWRDTSLTKRQQIMFNFREILNATKQELAAIVTEEHGKTLPDALGEVTRGLEVVEYATSLASHLKGSYSESVSTSIDVYSIKQSLGVVGIISPFNFPAMVPMWFFPIAIAAGNTVVLKPSEKNPTAAIWMAEKLKEAGLPDGVFNVLQGDKVAVDELLTNSAVQAISFVGSTPIAKYVYETGTAHGKRVQSLGGAKNHMLVLPDADLDLVADSAINAGFGSAGERCMAISVVVAVEPVADSLIEKIKSRMSTLKVGDGTRNCDMGPLVTKEHRDKVASYIDIAIEDKATVVVDGRGVEVDGEPNGFWLGPTLIDNVPTSSRVYKDEIFGPVLSIVRVASYEEGLELINNGAYGNGTAIFTNDGGAARKFQNEVEVGMIGINVPIPVPVSYYSFGGFKSSLFGDTKAHGVQGFHFYTREKTITSRWLDPSHGGINLGFPQN
jgi:malonate-semialdehyde dehydrogenase (acetylating)/methylmalonate-semialdehyde dehydrogenase